VAISLLRNRGVVKEDLSGHYHLAERDLGRDDMARFVRDYEHRDDRDRLELQRLVEYAETRGCRWKFLLEYFGDGASDECGRCDRCEPLTAGA
jgi:ATP-dependent DNA helicase RecQ